MNTTKEVGAGPERATAPGLVGARVPRARRPTSQGPPRWRSSVVALLLAGALALAWASGFDLSRLRGIGTEPAAEAPGGPSRTGTAAPSAPWDGRFQVDARSHDAIGLDTVAATPQVEPIRLEVLGTTGYMTDSQTKVRPMFEGRADTVRVTVGQDVAKGDPLVDFYSTEVAGSKSDFEVKSVQRDYDQQLLERYEVLRRSSAIPARLFEETKRDAMKSRAEAKVAHDRLRLYGLTEAEIARIKDEDGDRKARLTLCSPASGVVISRDVVAGNLYDENDTLLVIAPIDRLWVWGHVFESDLDKVRLGQPWEIRFPFHDLNLRGTVEHIASQVDPRTRTVKVRTSIPNPEGRLKSDMIVHGWLELPPMPGRVVIPRAALIVADGPDSVFVKVAGTADQFERRTVRVVHETNQSVVLDGGVSAGEEVVRGGSLILAQLDQERRLFHPDFDSLASDDARAP